MGKDLRLAIVSGNDLVVEDVGNYGTDESKSVVVNVIDRSFSLTNKKIEGHVKFDRKPVDFDDLNTYYTKKGKSAPIHCKDEMTKYVQIDMEGALSVGFNGNLLETITFEVSEVVVQDGVITEKPPACSITLDWNELFSITQQNKPIVMRDGVMPVAILDSEVSFINPLLAAKNKDGQRLEENYDCENMKGDPARDGRPDFSNRVVRPLDKDNYTRACFLQGLMPGFAFLWGEPCHVTWERNSWP